MEDANRDGQGPRFADEEPGIEDRIEAVHDACHDDK